METRRDENEEYDTLYINHWLYPPQYFQVLQYGVIHVERTQIFRKNNISYPLTRVHQRVRNVSFSENFEYVLTECYLFMMSQKFQRE